MHTSLTAKPGWHLPPQPDLCRWRCLICQQQSLSKDPVGAWEWHWRLRHADREGL